MDVIKIRGARQHNLKDVNVKIPRGKFVVITGPSGSGKSSLAFHTLYAEGQRRYVESLSVYARQFLEQLEKPNVDSIEGLSPAVAIEQKTVSGNPRSTIATVTEIYDYLRVLYAAVGVPYDPVSGDKLEKMSSAEIVNQLLLEDEGTKVVVLSPVPLNQITEKESILEDLQRQGFVRVRMNGLIMDADEALEQWPDELKRFEVVVDRLAIRKGVESRLADSVETSLRICEREVRCIILKNHDDWQEVSFATTYRNPATGFEIAALTPQDFSFNSHKGACERCHGLGTYLYCEPKLLVPDPTRSIASGAIKLAEGIHEKWILLQIDDLIKQYKIDVTLPFEKLPNDFIKVLFYGDHNAEDSKNTGFEGLCITIERMHREKESGGVKKRLGKYMQSRLCHVCEGKRLKPNILAVKIDFSNGARGIQDFCALSLSDALESIDLIKIPKVMQEVSQGLLTEIRKRLRFLNDVGLGYLSLNRSSASLSGGEAQRIRLATQIGAGLTGVIYVLDEPSIGLHQEDNMRLIKALKRLRDIGNTVVVVEHDEEIILQSDWLIDIGPVAGIKGGYVLFEGAPEDIKNNKDSPTGRWLGNKSSEISRSRPNAIGKLIVKGARANNLQNIDVTFPLGQIVCVTGPSGSGKSTLINTVLKRALAQNFNGAKEIPGAHDSIEGYENIDRLIIVDQSPIGRSPRSNPATYSGAMDIIRQLFARLKLSRQRGYDARRFSFNLRGGRCEKCSGDGKIKIDMHFLNDVFVNCDACNGARYNRETLEVTYKGMNIAEVLLMNVDEAYAFFKNIPKLKIILKSIADVGLGYIKLGQAANTLSGGEAQRIKLATELAKKSSGSNLYLLDEPTTGLHFYDVQVLVGVFKRLRDEGNSLIIVEHQLDVIRQSDWVIDLGPTGGNLGGHVVASGTPEKLKKMKNSNTGRWL